MTGNLPNWLHMLDAITRRQDGGYVVDTACVVPLRQALARYGYQLDKLATHRELKAAIRACNSADFTALMRLPAPSNELRMIWRRLRNLGRTPQNGAQ